MATPEAVLHYRRPVHPVVHPAYLLPMLENAGANVFTPRERDTQKQEVIVDNDGCLTGRSVYTENSGDKLWSQGEGQGFAHLRPNT